MLVIVLMLQFFLLLFHGSPLHTIQKKGIVWRKDTLQTVLIAGHLVDIRLPAQGEIKGNIIVLPGWSFSKEDWCNKSTLCNKALAQGYCLILPEMSKSVYSGAYYPETVKDWQKFPNKAWITTDMIPTLQKKHNILLSTQKNFILGLSTGGRGVALIALAQPTLFTAVASISGDFDQTQMATDRLMIGYYGSYLSFKSRWEGEDNPTKQAHLWQTPIYLGHGKMDNIVPFTQTKMFYDAVKKHNPTLKMKLNLPAKAMHDYAYWDSEVDNMLAFFANFLEK